MFYLSQGCFPPVSETKSHVIVTLGELLVSERLISIKRNFPWFERRTYYLVVADPRMVLFLDELVVSKSMQY
jgi:leucyl/phenylalanyl-tRNA--protein transferase